MTTLPGALAPNARPSEPSAEGSLSAILRGPFLFGAAVVVLFFGMFGAWAAMAPLASGALASGIVEADTGAQVVQHLEGGIIRSLPVRDGDLVTKGQVLVEMVPIRAEAQFSSDQQKWLRYLILRARLEAQSENLAEVKVPEAVSERNDPELNKFLAAQLLTFQTRRDRFESEMDILNNQIEQIHNQISAIESQNEGLRTRKALVDQQVADLSALFEKELALKSTYYERQETQAQIFSEIAANDAKIAEARNAIAGKQHELIRTRLSYQTEVADEITQVNNEIAQIDESLVSTRDVLDRTQIVSPVDGTVTKLQFHTTGGVIRSGDPIMEIVPAGVDQVVVAKLEPRDIDVVRIGLQAKVQLLPFQDRNRLPLNGEVVNIAADSAEDQATGQRFYQVRIKISAEELALHDDVHLSAGMPAEVIIVAGEQTFLDYLVLPFMRSLERAFVYD